MEEAPSGNGKRFFHTGTHAKKWKWVYLGVAFANKWPFMKTKSGMGE